MPPLAARRADFIACQLQDSLDDGAAGIRGSGKDLQDFDLTVGQHYTIREGTACVYADAHRLTPIGKPWRSKTTCKDCLF